MTKITPLLILITFFIGACSDSDKSTQAQNSSNKSSVESASQGRSCLDKYQAEPWTLFTLEELANFANLPASDGVMEEPIEMKNLSSRATGVKWNTGRTMTTEVTGDMKIPVSDTLTFGRFEILDPERIEGSFVDYFYNSYRSTTEEEQAQLEQAFAKELENEGDLTKEIGQGFVNISNSINFQTIDGIGDAASWQTNPKSPDGFLHVLHKNMTFVVVTNLNDDRNYNLGVAKKLGLAIIEKCAS